MQQCEPRGSQRCSPTKCRRAQQHGQRHELRCGGPRMRAAQNLQLRASLLPRCRQPDKSKAPFQSRAARVENGLHPLHRERFSPSWKRQKRVHARMRPPTRPAAATTWAEKGGGRGRRAVRTAWRDIMPLCFAMCLVCSCALQQRRRHTDHTVLPGARCGLRGFAPGRLAGISPAVMAAVVAAHHLLDLLEQRLGRRLHAARVRLHPPHRVARRDEEGAERRPAEAAARRGLRCLDH